MIVEFVYGITPSLKIDKPNHEEFICGKITFFVNDVCYKSRKKSVLIKSPLTHHRFLLHFSERVLLHLINL